MGFNPFLGWRGVSGWMRYLPWVGIDDASPLTISYGKVTFLDILFVLCRQRTLLCACRTLTVSIVMGDSMWPCENVNNAHEIQLV